MRLPASTIVLVALTGCCANPTCGDPLSSIGTIWVLNETPDYLHVVHGSTQHLYLPPDDQAQIEVFHERTILRVAAAPGQRSEGVVAVSGLCCVDNGITDCGHVRITTDAEGQLQEQSIRGECPVNEFCPGPRPPPG